MNNKTGDKLYDDVVWYMQFKKKQQEKNRLLMSLMFLVPYISLLVFIK